MPEWPLEEELTKANVNASNESGVVHRLHTCIAHGKAEFEVHACQSNDQKDHPH